MDLLRIEAIGAGPVYIDARALFLLARDGENTNLGVVLGPVGKDLTIAGDVDEVAAMLESAYHACRIYHVG